MAPEAIHIPKALNFTDKSYIFLLGMIDTTYPFNPTYWYYFKISR